MPGLVSLRPELSISITRHVKAERNALECPRRPVEKVANPRIAQTLGCSAS